MRNVSYLEFFWKYWVSRGKIAKVRKQVCLMVTPAMPATAANVSNDRHEVYARTCVVAYWRCMASTEKYDLLRRLDSVDPRLVGGTVLELPPPHAGSLPSQLDRFIGIRDLVEAFDLGKVKEMSEEMGVEWMLG